MKSESAQPNLNNIFVELIIIISFTTYLYNHVKCDRSALRVARKSISSFDSYSVGGDLISYKFNVKDTQHTKQITNLVFV